MRLCILIVFVCGAAVTFAEGKLPSFIEACSASDSHLNECAARSMSTAGSRFADGIPELGVAALDPLKLGAVDVPNPALNLALGDTVVTGLKGFKVNSFKINPQLGKASLDFVANVTLKANYKMDGQVLILAIRGAGQSKIKITNLNIVIKYDYVTQNGHWLVTSHKDTFKMDRVVFKFTNLFGGRNKLLADTTHKFLNDNWALIMQEIANPTVEGIIKKCVEEVKKFYRAVPADELLKP